MRKIAATYAQSSHSLTKTYAHVRENKLTPTVHRSREAKGTQTDVCMKTVLHPLEVDQEGQIDTRTCARENKRTLTGNRSREAAPPAIRDGQ